MIDRLKRRFDRLVHQAIIDGLELHRKRRYGLEPEPDENEKQQQLLFLLIAAEVWIGIIFVLTAKAIGEG